METDYLKENIVKNVRIIAYALIVIHLIGLYQSMGGINLQRENAMVSKLGAQLTQFMGLSAFPWYISMIIVVSLLIGIIIIYYAVLVLQFNEKGRANLCRVLVVSIVFQVVSSISNLFMMMDFSYGFNWMMSSSFIIAVVFFAIFTFTMSMLNYLFYRYLNKPEVKALFIAEYGPKLENDSFAG